MNKEHYREQERCPKCGGFVYAEHYREQWIIRCCQCNSHTGTHKSHDGARKAWDKMIADKESD